MEKWLEPYINFAIAGVRESMLNPWKQNIFDIIDEKFSFYSNNFDHLLPEYNLLLDV